MTLPQVADSLAGRMSITELLPLSQTEVHGKPCDFLDRVFQGRAPAIGPIVLADDLVELVSRGGYPEALERTSWARRQKWLLDYSKAIIERDVQHIAKVDQLRHMPKLLRLLAEHSAQLINFSGLGAPLGLSHHTTQKYTGILEQLFLIRSLQPWYHNAIKKIVKTPKLHFLDSGLLAALRNLSPEKLKSGRTQFGALLETFVLAELLKLASWSGRHLEFFHYRDRNDDEVDIVIEDPEGRVVGIEVKASATSGGEDFSGLRKLAGICGKQFTLGLVLYDHDTVVPFAEKMFAVPISSLWG
jgi:predicted AAA+ superfamily ATPase